MNVVMKMKYTFKNEDLEAIKAARKKNRDKQIDKRLEVLDLRCEGMTQKAIAEATGFHLSHVSNLIRKYFEEGLESVAEKHYPGNRRNMSYEEECAFLEEYSQKAAKGQILSVKEMASDYAERVGHSISSAQIYRVLHRHGWRKVMPRSRHPKRASEEVIATSKKLTAEFTN